MQNQKEYGKIHLLWIEYCVAMWICLKRTYGTITLEDYMEIVLSIILLAAALSLVVSVLLQSGKSHGLSGTISGGAETFFGKTKGQSMDKKLSKLTAIVAAVFVVLVLAVYVTQDNKELSHLADNGSNAETAAQTDAETGSGSLTTD